MKRTYVIGDVHFSDARPWDLETFSKFIDWFERDLAKDVDKENSEIIFLGDLTERAVNNGKPIEMLTKLMKIALDKFSNVIVIGGNHDMKETIDGSCYYSTQYLSQLGDVKVVLDEEQFVSKMGVKITALPHKKTIGTISSYYNKSLPEKFYNESCDLIVGHVTLYDPAFPYIDGVNLKRFHYKHAAFGHIHQRFGQNAELYTGSIMPFRKSEMATDIPRQVEIFYRESDGDKLKKTAIDIPTFRVYEKIDYNLQKPQHKKGSTFEAHIYEVFNCSSSVVQSLSNDYYVTLGKKADQAEAKSTESIASAADIVFKSKLDAFKKMIDNEHLHYKRSTMKMMNELLSL